MIFVAGGPDEISALKDYTKYMNKWTANETENQSKKNYKNRPSNCCLGHKCSKK